MEDQELGECMVDEVLSLKTPETAIGGQKAACRYRLRLQVWGTEVKKPSKSCDGLKSKGQGIKMLHIQGMNEACIYTMLSE